MIRWFRADAPIRIKFNILLALYTFLICIPCAALWIVHNYPGSFNGAVASALAAVFGTVILGIISKRLICDTYVSTVVRMEALAEGNFHAPIQYTEFKDCVGRMNRAMLIFRTNGMKIADTTKDQQHVVAAIGGGLAKLAAYDLSHRIADIFPPDYESLRLDFNSAMDSVEAVITAVAEATHRIDNGAHDIRQASDDLSQRTEQQAASLEETAAAMDEITGTVRNAAASAVQADKTVSEARQEAEHSGDVVRRTVEAMNGIERSSTEIGEIIGVIDGIAFQTNLLALNAGVEAARAGDAGKGFAVVASEVRALAQRSADAAHDVKLKVTASSEQVKAGVELVNETGEALQRIILRIVDISNLIGTIAASAEQQATGLQQVNVAVGEMDGVTQQNAAMVEEATAAARKLSQEANELLRKVSSFKLLNAADITISSSSNGRYIKSVSNNDNQDTRRFEPQTSAGTKKPMVKRFASGWSEF